ncbi:hypothetical protein WJX79_008103 [Trebouxia sp. C0005]
MSQQVTDAELAVLEYGQIDLQERNMAAAHKAAVTEQGLRCEIVSLQEALQRAHAASLDNDTSPQR